MLKKLFESDLEREEILNFYVTQKGYRFAGEHNHIDGHFLLFDSPTKYHSLDENENWVLDTEAWLDNEVRFYRDYLLEKSDFSQVDDVRGMHSVEMQLLWRKYRKDLRELPQSIEVVGVKYTEIPWPERPDSKNTLDLLSGLK